MLILEATKILFLFILINLSKFRQSYKFLRGKLDRKRTGGPLGVHCILGRRNFLSKVLWARKKNPAAMYDLMCCVDPEY